MLGIDGDPQLLVSVDDNYNPTNFAFTVINGAWDGTFKDGEIRVNDKYDNEPVGYSIKILTDNQDRLRYDFTAHDDYTTVFANFHNPNYVAPQYEKFEAPAYRDDDIPF